MAPRADTGTCVGGRGRANLRSWRHSCRSGRSSEPSCEAGTHPRDGQGRALSSARPLGPPQHAPSVLKMRIASLRACNAHVSSQTRAQTIQHRMRIAGICGARQGVVESKCGTPGSSNCRGARGGTTPPPHFPPALRDHCARRHAYMTRQRLYSASSEFRELV